MGKTNFGTLMKYDLMKIYNNKDSFIPKMKRILTYCECVYIQLWTMIIYIHKSEMFISSLYESLSLRERE